MTSLDGAPVDCSGPPNRPRKASRLAVALTGRSSRPESHSFAADQAKSNDSRFCTEALLFEHESLIDIDTALSPFSDLIVDCRGVFWHAWVLQRLGLSTLSRDACTAE